MRFAVILPLASIKLNWLRIDWSIVRGVALAWKNRSRTRNHLVRIWEPKHFINDFWHIYSLMWVFVETWFAVVSTHPVRLDFYSTVTSYHRLNWSNVNNVLLSAQSRMPLVERISVTLFAAAIFCVFVFFSSLIRSTTTECDKTSDTSVRRKIKIDTQIVSYSSSLSYQWQCAVVLGEQRTLNNETINSAGLFRCLYVWIGADISTTKTT